MRAILKRYLLVRMDPRAYITCSTSFFPRLIRRLAPMESSCCWFGLLFRALNNPQRQAGQMTLLVGRSSRSGSGGRYIECQSQVDNAGPCIWPDWEHVRVRKADAPFRKWRTFAKDGRASCSDGKSLRCNRLCGSFVD